MKVSIKPTRGTGYKVLRNYKIKMISGKTILMIGAFVLTWILGMIPMIFLIFAVTSMANVVFGLSGYAYVLCFLTGFGIWIIGFPVACIHSYWKKKYIVVPGTIHPLIEALKDDTEYVRKCAAEALERIINSNKPYQESYPHLICGKCFLKTKKNKIKPLRFKAFVFVACRSCGTSIHLLQNIRKVVGIVGGDIEDYYTEKDCIYINLWSESQKKARNADIDILEIREAQGISYEYAINAVLVTLKNDVSRPKEYVKNIPVVIYGNPPVPKGARLMIAHEFGEIRNEEC